MEVDRGLLDVVGVGAAPRDVITISRPPGLTTDAAPPVDAASTLPTSWRTHTARTFGTLASAIGSVITSAIATRGPESLMGEGEHVRREVDTDDRVPGVGQRQGHRRGADPDLEHGARPEPGHDRPCIRSASFQAAAGFLVDRRQPVEVDRGGVIGHGDSVAEVLGTIGLASSAAHAADRDARGDGSDRRRRARAGRGADRAGRGAVARMAIRMLDGTYGRTVVVLAGKGNNGNDGRDAARRLRKRGVRVIEIDAHGSPDVLPPADLVIDAAFGTGFRGSWRAPATDDPVLAVDIPSGVDGLTGATSERVLGAERTVTFAALKPGLLLPPGNSLAGEIEVADIGLDVSGARAHLVEDADVAAWLPERPETTHKWKAAVWVVAGSPGMTGAAHLAARGAQRSGAGYVRLGIPGLPFDEEAPTEIVGFPLPAEGWASAVLGDLGRFKSAVVGPGLGRARAHDRGGA